MFVSILTDMFNHWFARSSIYKGVISLLKKGGKRVFEELNDDRCITLLNTVKDFSPDLGELFACCCQGTSIQNNLYSVNIRRDHSAHRRRH